MKDYFLNYEENYGHFEKLFEMTHQGSLDGPEWDGPRPSLRASDRPIRRADIKDKIYIKNYQMGQSEMIFLNLTVLSTLT